MTQALTITASVIQLPVPDLAERRSWYTGLIGREPDLEPTDQAAEWQIHPNCWVQLVAARPDPGRNRLGLFQDLRQSPVSE